MAFEDFKENKPVIVLGYDSYGKKDEKQEDIYNRTRILDGAEAKPDTFNISIMDSINRDISLENALTYMARCASFYTSNNTKFLSHCEGSGTDIVSYKNPQLIGTVLASDLFVEDPVFLGAAYPQGHVENIIRSTSVVDSRLPRKNTGGWHMNIPEEDIGKYVSIAEYIDDGDITNTYLKVSTSDVSTPTVTPITVTLTSDKVPLSNMQGIIPSQISTGIHIKTNDNMYVGNFSVKYTINLYASPQATSPVQDGTRTVILSNKSSYNNTIDIIGYDMPEEMRATNNPYFNVEVEVKFESESKTASVQLSRIMVQEGGALSPYTRNVREETYCQYNNVIPGDVDEYTVLYWSMFKRYSTLIMSTDEIGPVFLHFNNATLGCVHRRDVIGGSFNLCLALNNNGEISYSPIIDLPETCYDSYILSAIRVRKINDLTHDYEAELAITLADKVYTTKILIPTNTFIGNGNIVLGTDKPLDTMFETYAGFFNGPITEVRYDEEWLNDLELYILNLAKKPFSYKQSTDSQITTEEKTPTEVIDSAGINLLQNPTGRFGLLNWNNSDRESAPGFTVSHYDAALGNCFKYASGASPVASNIIVYSDPITVLPNTLYSLRSVMMLSQDAEGDVGIAVRWLPEGTDFNLSSDMSDDVIIKAHYTAKPTYYAAQRVSPDTAAKAVVYMFALAGAKNVSMGWSKIKLEQGQPTFFTDDSGANYGVYY